MAATIGDLAAPTIHDSVLQSPRGGAGNGSFAVHNHYQDQADPQKRSARKTFVSPFPLDRRAISCSGIQRSMAPKSFTFGDQEEMGIGFRVATPIRVETESEGDIPEGNGTILDSKGRQSMARRFGATPPTGVTIAAHSMASTWE